MTTLTPREAAALPPDELASWIVARIEGPTSSRQRAGLHDDIEFAIGVRDHARATDRPVGGLCSVEDVDRVCVEAGLVRATSTRSTWMSGTGMSGVTVRVGAVGTDWMVSVRDGMGGVLIAEVGAETHSAALLREAIAEAQRVVDGEQR